MKILVVGDSILDRYLWGVVNRMSPEDESVPVVDIKKEEYRLGGCLNVAANIRSLVLPEAEVKVLAPVSTFTQNLLSNYNITTLVSYMSQQDAVAPHPKELVKTRVVDMNTNKQLIRVDNNETYEVESFYKYRDFNYYDILVISDYCKGFVDEPLISSLKNYKGQVFVDTKKPDLAIWSAIENCVVKINSKEFSKSKGIHSLKHCVVTEGGCGATLYYTPKGTRGMLSKKFVTTAVKNPEVTGCGDVFLAGLVSNYADTKDLTQAVEYANIVARESAKQFGTTVVKRKE